MIPIEFSKIVKEGWPINLFKLVQHEDIAYI